jgi:hypothetical protein
VWASTPTTVKHAPATAWLHPPHPHPATPAHWAIRPCPLPIHARAPLTSLKTSSARRTLHRRAWATPSSRLSRHRTQISWLPLKKWVLVSHPLKRVHTSHPCRTHPRSARPNRALDCGERVTTDMGTNPLVFTSTSHRLSPRCALRRRVESRSSSCNSTMATLSLG